MHALGGASFGRGLEIEGEGAGNACVMTGALAFRGGAAVVVVVGEEGILHRQGYIITMRKKAE